MRKYAIPPPKKQHKPCASGGARGSGTALRGGASLPDSKPFGQSSRLIKSGPSYILSAPPAAKASLPRFCPSTDRAGTLASKV